MAGPRRQWGWHQLTAEWSERFVAEASVDAGSLVVDVVASPPFAVTAALLGRLLQKGSRLLSARLILQDQAARRWAAYDAPGARRWSNTFEVSLGPSVPRRAFSPPPRVDARVLVVARRNPRGVAARRYDSNP